MTILKKGELRAQANAAAEDVIDRIERIVEDAVSHLRTEEPDIESALEVLDALAEGLY